MYSTYIKRMQFGVFWGQLTKYDNITITVTYLKVTWPALCMIYEIQSLFFPSY